MSQLCVTKQLQTFWNKLILHNCNSCRHYYLKSNRNSYSSNCQWDAIDKQCTVQYISFPYTVFHYGIVSSHSVRNISEIFFIFLSLSLATYRYLSKPFHVASPLYFTLSSITNIPKSEDKTQLGTGNMKIFQQSFQYKAS